MTGPEFREALARASAVPIAIIAPILIYRMATTTELETSQKVLPILFMAGCWVVVLQRVWKMFRGNK